MEATTEASTPITARIPLYSIIISSVVTLECIVCIILNPITIAAIVFGGFGQKSAIHLFITSLSVSDLLSGLAFLSFQIQRWVATLGGVHPSLVTISWISSTLSAAAFPGSLLSAMAIGIDRAFATSKPMSYKRTMSQRNGKLILAVLCQLCYTCSVSISEKYDFTGRLFGVVLPHVVAANLSVTITFCDP
ncbi:hypothetical protein CAPTEDRAFT_206363 [Capitella teleta]|uniref:G-protein coupled receptors family 1 profile domain-containing protein n=1 Tax=Capitella teleta TaxID=283909 RepID=R7UCF9_CAPTE|nr:hypothetical protein CAPTEDRAFT_206363 [Capitella teleta]|eukprot:ELU03689.1 hypothetical protein CAPTEDRAFT_206363 [Capitella teleta]